MKKIANRIFIGCLVFLLTGCANGKDVRFVQEIRNATDLIRADNELTRLLVEVRPDDEAGAATYLQGLAANAKENADKLKNDPATYADAIAFYRIAATAYWRSGTETPEKLFEVTDNGTALCDALGENSPDRDCLFMKLVIPFAALEAISQKSKKLSDINFNDHANTENEIEDLKEIWLSLNKAKPVIEEILSIGGDNRFVTHKDMRDYYCRNAKQARDSFDNNVGLIPTKIRDYEEDLAGDHGPLGITKEKAREFRTLRNEVPSFCSSPNN